MKDSIKRISLDLHNTNSRETVKVKRSDTGRKIYVSLVDGGMPYHISEDCYAVFTGKKPDGNILFNDCTIEGNVIIYKLTEQTASVPGLVKCEIRLYGADAQLITSPKFSIIVEDTVYNEGDVIESEGEVEALTQLISDATEAISEANDAASNADAAAQEIRDARENGEFKGDPGEKGDTGATGPKGDKGDKGDSGEDYVLTDEDKEEIAKLSTLVVTVTNNVASHTPPEIFTHVQSGGTAMLFEDGFYAHIEECTAERVTFARFDDGVSCSHYLSTGILKYYKIERNFRDKIDKPTKAEVGQTIVVKSVDSSGVPTVWETVDMVAKVVEALPNYFPILRSDDL